MLGEHRDSWREQARESEPNVVNNTNNYYGPVNNVGQAYNANLGVNTGSIIQNAYQSPSPLQSPGMIGGDIRCQIVHVSGLAALLNPILDASHTRNRKTSPPNSDCFPGTRTDVIQDINSWARSSLSSEPQHILWVFGYAGCGKSAIAQAVATLLADSHRLGASFFFFRGSGDRSRMSSFPATLASQVATAIPGTSQRIEAALKAHPGLLQSTTSMATQLKHLLYDPIRAVTAKWYRPSGVWRPYIIVIDGLDECEDKDAVSDFIKDLIEFFDRKPDTPLRFLVTSRVEDHLHQRLHNSSQVRLLNLVDHTSNRDIAAALDAAIEDARGSRVLTCEGAWLTPEDKKKLIEHIGGSFIFMTTITKPLFAPYNIDKRTPSARLPLALNMNPGFDGLYMAILAGSRDFPHFSDILTTIALAQEPLSISQITELLDIDTIDVVSVLVNLHAIIQVPGDDHSPVTLWHTSLRDFLTSESRAGPFFADPAQHERLALRCVDLDIRPRTTIARLGSAATLYAGQYIWDHYRAFFGALGGKGDLHSKTLTHVDSFMYLFMATAPQDVLDQLCMSILASSQHFPFFFDIIKTAALMQTPLTVSQVADLLTIMSVGVTKALAGLHPFVKVMEDQNSSVTFPYPCFLAFLHSEGRSGRFFAGPKDHGRLAYRAVCILDPLTSHLSSPAREYSQEYAIIHWKKSLESLQGNPEALEIEVRKFIGHLRTIFSSDFSIMSPFYLHVDHRFIDKLLEVHRHNTVLSFLGAKCPQAILNDEQPWVLIKTTFQVVDAALGEGGLLTQMQHLSLPLIDVPHHVDMVMRGVQLLVKRRASDDVLILLCGGAQRDYPTDYLAEYMFASWAKHVALARRGNPEHPAFDSARPARIQIQGRETGWPWYSCRRDWLDLAVSNLNLEATPEAGSDRVIMEPQGVLTHSNKWDWDIKGHFVLKQPTTDTVTVYDVLDGLRALLSCYRSTCGHIAAHGGHCRYKDRHWEEL